MYTNQVCMLIHFYSSPVDTFKKKSVVVLYFLIEFIGLTSIHLYIHKSLSDCYDRMTGMIGMSG